MPMPTLAPVLSPPLWSEIAPVVAAAGDVAEPVGLVAGVEVVKLEVVGIDVAELVVVLELETSVILKVSPTATGLVSPS